jgi:hypothetical protein
MKAFGRLAVSIGNESADDSMRVFLHEADGFDPLIEGIIKGDRARNERTVAFLTPGGERVYSFEDVRQAILEFIELMTKTENVTYEDIIRDAAEES